MSRIEKNTVAYFPHDSMACQGDTLTVLQSQFGNNGYAVWFKLLEKLASSDGHYINCRNSIKWKLLVAYLGADEITTVEMMKLLVEMQAIDKDLWDSRVIWCQKLVDNFADVYKNRRRELPQKPIITNNNPITTNNNAITTVDKQQSKVNKSKVNNTKVYKNKYGTYKNVLLSKEDYNKLIEELGEVETKKWIETLSEGKARSGYKYKNDYLAIKSWRKREPIKKGQLPTAQEIERDLNG